MKKRLISILLHVSIVLCLISIYCLLIENNSIFEWIIFSLTIIGLILCILFWKDLRIAANESSFYRLISIISLEIALIVFIQTSIQVEKNNEQFEKNRIASDSLFRTQLKHSKELNQLQIENAQKLNDSLIQELFKIQNINSKNNLAAENQLLATKKQLELSKQSLQDYIYATRAELILGKTEIVKIDTLNNSDVRLSIENKVYNSGSRLASKVECRMIIIFKNEKHTKLEVEYYEFINPKTMKYLTYYTPITQKESKDFFYWIQIRYFDERLEKNTDQSYYFHYYKSVIGFDFCDATIVEKPNLRRLVDNELEKKGLSTTVN